MVLTHFILLLITADASGFSTRQFPMSNYEQCVEFSFGILQSNVRELPMCVGVSKDKIGFNIQPKPEFGQYWDLYLHKTKDFNWEYDGIGE